MKCNNPMIEPRYKKHSGRLYASLFCAWWISFSLTAQDKIDKEVYVVKPYEPTLSDAYKISRMPEINDTVQEKPVFDYSITGRKISPDVQVAPIPAARMVPDPIPRLYKSYLKLGLGTYTTPLLELNVNSLRSKKFNLGLEARHLSSHGNIGLEDNTKTYGGFSRSSAALYGKTWFSNMVLSGDLGIASNTFYRYGNALDSVIRKEDMRQGYLSFVPSFRLKTLQEDSTRMNIDIRGNYSFFRESGGGYENAFQLGGSFNKLYKKNWLGADVDVHFRRPSEGIDTAYATVLTFSPYFNRHSAEWSFVAGFGTAVDIYGGEASFHIYPRAQLEFQVLPGILTAYFGASGQTILNEYRMVADENPFINPTLYVKTTNEKIRGYGGIRGSAGDFSFRAGASYSLLDRLPFYVNDTITPLLNQFTVLYDNAELTAISAEAGYQLNSKLNLMLRGNYYHYSMDLLEHPYQRPPFDISLIGIYNLRDKIVGRAELYVWGKRYARSNAQVYENRELSAFADLNLHLEYRFTKVLSFFLTGNNLTANRYQLWNYYPVQRFRVMLGFTYAL